MNEFVLADLHEGLSIEKSCDITADDISAFAEFSGDWSSIHIDEEYAQGRGFEGCLVHGLLIGSLISGFIGMILPGKHGLLQMVNLQFRNPTYAPDRLAIKGTVSRVSEAAMSVVINLRVIGENGQERVRGQSNSILKS